jgi:hypothetical protein
MVQCVFWDGSRALAIPGEDRTRKPAGEMSSLLRNVAGHESRRRPTNQDVQKTNRPCRESLAAWATHGLVTQKLSSKRPKRMVTFVEVSIDPDRI